MDMKKLFVMFAAFAIAYSAYPQYNESYRSVYHFAPKTGEAV